MSGKDFYLCVKMMREAQKEYFRNRTKENLLKSIELERRVDNELIEVAKRLQ